jgi:hypothetical protein
MSKSLMSQFRRDFGYKEGLAIIWQGVETIPTCASEKKLFRGSILDKEKIGVKFNISIIINSQFSNRNEMLIDLRCIKNMIQMQRPI